MWLVAETTLMGKSGARVLLLEGTCGVGKTTLARAIEAVAARQGLGVQVVEQRYTYGVIAPWEDLGLLDEAMNHDLLRRLIQWLMAQMATSPDDLIVVDTLHLTQHLRPGVLTRERFSQLDVALAEAGVRLLLVTAIERELEERVIIGRAGTPFRRYAAKYGPTDEALLRYLCEEQRRFRELLGETALPCLEISSGSMDAMADVALGFALRGVSDKGGAAHFT